MDQNNSPGMSLAGLFQAEKGRMTHFVRSKLKNTSDRDAEDIVQDVFTGILEKSDPMRPIGNLVSYVYQAIRNRIIDLYRKPERTVSFDELEEREGIGAMDSIMRDARFDTLGQVEKQEFRERLVKALDTLPPEQKAVWVSIELENMTFTELSALWNEPAGTLLSRKHRATLSLRKKLADLIE